MQDKKMSSLVDTSNFNETKDLIANQALKVTSTAKVFFTTK